MQQGLFAISPGPTEWRVSRAAELFGALAFGVSGRAQVSGFRDIWVVYRVLG